MWVVFWTGGEHLDTYSGQFVRESHYEIVGSQEQAATKYKEKLTLEDTYFAGYGPISQGTEPQWTDSETTAKTEKETLNGGITNENKE